MGFRSTYISEDWNVKWPSWFREKHKDWINASNMIVSPCEVKFADEIMQDIHKALRELKWFDNGPDSYSMVGIHECGGVSKVEFYEDSIYAGHPLEWEVERQEDWVNSQFGHVYCYGCSDLKKKEKEEIKDQLTEETK